MWDKLLVALVLIIYLSNFAATEDKLKPVIDEVCSIISAVSGGLGDIFFSLLPSFEDSLNEMMDFIDLTFPFMKDFHWVIYLAIFLAVMLVLSRLWKISRHYIWNSITGIILLLILIHPLGVEIKITLLTLIIVALFGVPGVLFTLIMHYFKIVI
jgi:hypothetical protein